MYTTTTTRKNLPKKIYDGETLSNNKADSLIVGEIEEKKHSH